MPTRQKRLDPNQFSQELDEACGQLQQDPKAWEKELTERSAWDVTLMDGLKPEDLVPPKKADA